MTETPAIFHGLPVKGLFTTRRMGTSEEGLRNISDTLGVPPSSIYLPIQEHTDRVIVVDHDTEPLTGDAVITDRKGIVIGIRVADCVPVLLYDRRRCITGAVHAGWRGTAEAILSKAIRAMEERFLSFPEDILVAIGPAIRGCCYEVGAEVVEAVERATGRGEYIAMREERCCLDLPSANRQQALTSGIPEGNIWVSGDCTSCLPEKYFSYRFSKGLTGRQYGLIGMIE